MAELRKKGFLERHLSWIALILVIVIALAAVLLNFNINILFLFLALLTAVVGVILADHHNTQKAKREERASRTKAIRDQLDNLYVRQATPIGELLGPTNEATWVNVVNRVESEIGGSQRCFACDSTLKAYDRRSKNGLTDRDWAIQLAKVFLEDKRKLEDEYRKLTQE